MSESTKVKSIRLAHHFKKDTINISHVEKPYGKYSDPIVMLDIIENGKKTGHLEIPYENLDAVIEALHKAEDVCNSIPHNDVHGELVASVGGGA